jgi:hypothetical protein
MALTTESRAILASALATTGVKVFSTPPATPKPPCIVIIPDQPWVIPGRIGSRLNYEVRWRILIVITPRVSRNADQTQGDAERILDQTLAALPPGFEVVQVGPPQFTDVGAQGTVVTTEIAVSAQMKE